MDARNHDASSTSNLINERTMAKRTIGQVAAVQKIWLSAQEAQNYLGCKKDFLRQIRENPDNRISFSRYGNKTFWYDVRSLQRFIERNKVI